MDKLFLFIIAISPLICERLFAFFWGANILDYGYELSKSLYITFAGVILLLIYLFKKDLNLEKKDFIIYIFWIISIFLSSYFWLNQENSFIWLETKWHTFYFWNSLFIIYILSKDIVFERIKKWLIISYIPVCLIAIKEIIWPSFEYSSFNIRALWTFGHHNYLALHLILIIPILATNLKNKVNIWTFTLINITLLLTQSLIWIWTAILYYSYLFYTKTKYKTFSIVWFALWITGILVYSYLHIDKFSSLISRFYIWKDSLAIWSQDISSILFWIWPENLFEKFIFYKSNELLIYENLRFMADRSHNLLVETTLSFWIIWLTLFLWIWYYLFNKIEKKEVKASIILGILFLSFNFTSSASLVFLAVIIWSSVKRTEKIINKDLLVIPLLIWLIWLYLFTNDNIKLKKEEEVLSTFSKENCTNLWEYKSPEIYFLCWDYTWEKEYYIKWMEKLPNFENLPEKLQISVERRLYNEKYWLPEIQRKIEEH